MSSVVLVAGARPNFMKIAPILRALARVGRPFDDILVHTGQHYDFAMSGVFFEQLGIREPDAYLQVGSGSHGVQTGRIMGAFEEYLASLPNRPRGIIVVGDVNSTMACALVAAKLSISVAHVEAGLRSFDRAMPEEINRLVTDAIADLLLVSEPAGMANLAREGVAADRIRYVGNVMIDSLVEQLAAARACDSPLALGVVPGTYAVVTLHRPSNVDDPDRLRTLVEFLESVAARMPVVFPIHPRTRDKLGELGLVSRLETNPAVKLAQPLGYRDFLGLMDSARVIVSDSGGIQEESAYLGIPCVTLRNTTERPVTVSEGTNVLVGDDLAAALAAVNRAVRRVGPCAIEGWDGQAGDRVVAALVAAWG